MALQPSSTPRKAGPAEEPPLSDEEIEAILAREAADPPPQDEAATEPRLAMREPGAGRWGKVMVWLMVGFFLLSAYHLYR
jgi:hypothetical protein